MPNRKRQAPRSPARKLRPAAGSEPGEPGGRPAQAERYLLRLYVTGVTPASRRAIENARALCQQHLSGRYQLEVYDIYQMPALAKDHQIIAAPTLVKVLPDPLRRFVGDLSRSEKVLFGLDLREKP
jgi:circadian clock protein KaiB